VCYPVGMSAPSSAEVLELLTRVPVFSTLETEDLQRIAQLAVPRRFEAGQMVFREGDASDTCYIVHTGHTRAVHQHGDGRIIALATFGPGDIFGELALFEDELRSATVEALEQTTAVAVLGPDMRRLMGEHPQIAMRLLIALGRRLREANERLARRSFQTVQSRVASVLGELVEQAQAAASSRSGREATGEVQAGELHGGPAGSNVAIVATQADLAKLAGSSRESASRFLAVLERAGVISQGRGRLVVHDPEALRSYVF
jgi:CRP-like cAMP-binding protein